MSNTPSPEALQAARYVMDNARDASENETIMANEIMRLSKPSLGAPKRFRLLDMGKLVGDENGDWIRYSEIKYSPLDGPRE